MQVLRKLGGAGAGITLLGYSLEKMGVMDATMDAKSSASSVPFIYSAPLTKQTYIMPQKYKFLLTTEVEVPWTVRKDVVTSAIINRGIEKLANGEYFAVSYLQLHGISISSIARITNGRHRLSPTDEAAAEFAPNDEQSSRFYGRGGS